MSTSQGFPQPAAAPRFSRTKEGVKGAAAKRGQHTDEVLLESGFSSKEVGDAQGRRRRSIGRAMYAPLDDPRLRARASASSATRALRGVIWQSLALSLVLQIAHRRRSPGGHCSHFAHFDIGWVNEPDPTGWAARPWSCWR